ncbi:hypothetical protein GCM10029964_034210 [Kibdelosporangium lantanae]
MRRAMKVRYRPWVGIILLVLGAVCAVLGLWLAGATGELNPSVFLGALIMLMGLLYLLRPYFWVYDASVEVAALVGPARRRFPYETLELDGNKLYAVQGDGKRRKVSVSKWMANGDDWAQFTAPLQRPVPPSGTSTEAA